MLRFSVNRAQARSFFAGVAVLALLTTFPAARAQNETTWKNFVEAGLQAAAVHDYATAEQALLKAVREAENFGASDARVGSTLNTLGLVYRAEKKYSEAEGVYRRALLIMEATYGESIDVGNINFNIASVMFDQGRQVDSLPNVRKALAIYEKLLGGASMKTAAALCMEGDVYRLTMHYPEAETALRRCADIREMDAGLQSNEVADAMYSLAHTFMAQGKFSAAEPRLAIAEKIREKTLGITSPLLAQTMEDHAAVLKELMRDREAAKLAEMAAAIRRNQKGK